MSLHRVISQKKHFDTKERRAETRTKIQLGGLVMKSGLADLLNIQLGDDLQLYEEHFDKAAILLGALLDACEFLDDKKTEWQWRGRKNLKFEFLKNNSKAFSLPQV